jgi:hypothetical protein
MPDPTRDTHEPSLETSPRVICIPSWDRAFTEVVAQALIAKPMRWTWDLQRVLRPFYPECRVHARALEGEVAITWYVYRDREFPESRTEDRVRD